MTLISKHFAVIGQPIKHSLSPHIHLLFAKQFELLIDYKKVEVNRETLLNRLDKFKSKKYSGLNVTLPLKHDAYLLCQELSEKSKLCESVNTISIKDNQFHGDTTDGIGLIRDLTRKGINLNQARILLVGAGGAANAVIADLIECSPSELHLTNRTIEKSMVMETHWKNFAEKNSVSLNISGNHGVDSSNYDVIINATSAGFSSNISPIEDILVNKKTYCYDMTYGMETPFMKQAIKLNATVFDGLGMLIEQAAESFHIWHKEKPETNKIKSELKLLKLI
ncbi:MAG: shikimate dehydrogenase [Gammaproteobacteria bacterium]|jgi:shikimate dehydrogenase|nr:shikimate dehydrogenase [Gammaproteobacteria bacterium]